MQILISEFFATPVVALVVRSFISGFVSIIAISIIMESAKAIIKHRKN